MDFNPATRAAQTPISIEEWLEGLQDQHPASASNSGNGSFQDEFEAEEGPRDGESAHPKTPRRKQAAIDDFAELSPTTATSGFSSVFDRPNSPTRESARLQEEVLYENSLSEITTFDDERSDTNADSKEANEALVAPSEAPTLAHSAGSLYWYEPPSTSSSSNSIDTSKKNEDKHDFDREPNPKQLPPNAPRPNTPQPIFLTSCLQCVLANLPCSRTLPSCARCIRNGSAAVCLPHRRKLFSELALGDSARNRAPVLLKVKGQDGEAWEMKLEVYRELMQIYTEREEKKNWVLPMVDSKRGSFGRRARGAHKVRLNEGKGRSTFVNLILG